MGRAERSTLSRRLLLLSGAAALWTTAARAESAERAEAARAWFIIQHTDSVRSSINAAEREAAILLARAPEFHPRVSEAMRQRVTSYANEVQKRTGAQKRLLTEIEQMKQKGRSPELLRLARQLVRLMDADDQHLKQLRGTSWVEQFKQRTGINGLS